MVRLIEKEDKKIVFVETDPQQPFPSDTINALKKEIKRLAKDMSIDWSSTNQLLRKAFEELQVPIPTANLSARWEQYKDLIKETVQALVDSRGFGANWSTI